MTIVITIVIIMVIADNGKSLNITIVHSPIENVSQTLEILGYVFEFAELRI